LRRSFYFLLFLLALAVTGREAPEIARLSDDVSNDGRVVESQSKVTPRLNSCREDQQDRLLFRNNDSLFVANLTDCTLIVPVQAGQDLLHLLRLQRK